MKTDLELEISETAEFGVMLQLKNVETADEFEDFLTEQCFVLFKVSLQSKVTLFHFGQASTSEKVHALYARFLATPRACGTDAKLTA